MSVGVAVAIIIAAVKFEQAHFVFTHVVKDRIFENAEVRFRGKTKINPALG